MNNYTKNDIYIRNSALNPTLLYNYLQVPCKQSEVVRMYFTKLREFITDNQHVIYQAINKKMH